MAETKEKIKSLLMKVKEESEKAGLKQHSKQNKKIMASSLISSVQFSHSVMSDSLWPHGLQHARPPCPSPSPRVYSNSHPLSRWCRPTISTSAIPFSSSLQSFPASGSFPMNQFFTLGGQSIGVSASAISSYNEYSEFISFKIDCFDLLDIQGTLKSFLQHHSPKTSILWCLAFSVPTLTSVHDYWKNHSFDYMDLCWQRSAF